MSIDQATAFRTFVNENESVQKRILAATIAVSISNGNAEHPTASQLEFFETPIRPMLVEP